MPYGTTFDWLEKRNILRPEDLSELRDVIADLASRVQAILVTDARTQAANGLIRHAPSDQVARWAPRAVAFTSVSG